MKDRNWRTVSRRWAKPAGTYLEEGVLLLGLELVGPEDLDAALGLLGGEASLVTLQQLEHVLDDDVLEIHLFSIVKILGLELDLGHVDVGIWAGTGQRGQGWLATTATDELASSPPRRNPCTLSSSSRARHGWAWAGWSGSRPGRGPLLSLRRVRTWLVRLGGGYGTKRSLAGE